MHVPRCTFLPEGDNGLYLGSFTRYSDAIEAAKAHFEGERAHGVLQRQPIRLAASLFP